MKLDFNQIDNLATQRNFEKLQAEFDKSPILSGQWKLMHILPTDPSGTYKIYHRLGFIPSDVVITKQVGTVTFNYSKFTDEFIEVTTTAFSECRFLLGRMKA